MRLKKMFKNKLAFTLVELVIAIAVMAILAGAVAGAVIGVRNNARKSTVTTPAATIKTDIQSYYNSDYKSTDTAEDLGKRLASDFEQENNFGGVSYGVTKATKTADGIKLGISLAKTSAINDGSVIIYVMGPYYYQQMTVNFANGKVTEETKGY